MISRRGKKTIREEQKPEEEVSKKKVITCN